MVASMGELILLLSMMGIGWKEWANPLLAQLQMLSRMHIMTSG